MGIYTYEPQGIIKIYRYIPLDNTYQNTLHFRTPEEQYNYFHLNDDNLGGVVKLNFSGQTITRNERQVIRIDHNYADLMDCNYLAYLNKPFATSNPMSNVGIWVYAFITSVEYISPHCTEIEFEIDVMQTFMWNYELRECFVEREHSEYDEIGDSLTPEPITDTALQTTSIQSSETMDYYDVVFFTACRVSTHDGSENPTLINKQEPYFQDVGGIPFGGDYVYFEKTQTVQMREFIKQCGNVGALESLVTAIYFPKRFSEQPNVSEIITINRPQNISGYVPKNNKLFTYPYNCLIVDNGQSEIVLRYEYFNGDEWGDPNSIKFTIRAFLSGQPQIRCEPLNYGGYKTGAVPNPEAKYVSVMENFPVIAFGGNNANNWLQQNAVGLTVTGAIDFGQIIGGVLTDNPIAVAGGLASLSRDVGNVATKMNTPATMLTNTRAFSDVLDNDREFLFKNVQVCAEGAEIVDNFFTMFGYNTQKVKIPNIRYYDDCRPLFNYIKCGQMSFHWELHATEGKGTSVPQKYMRKIMQIYQNGITFWKDPYKVGRYNEPNVAKTRG